MSIPPASEPAAWFRVALGFIAVLGGLGALVMLSWHPIPEENKEALLLAIGVVLGWGSSVISSEFGSSPGGRKAADVAIRRMDQPQSVRIDQPADDPVPVEPKE